MSEINEPVEPEKLSFIKRHQLIVFFGLAYGISWGSYFIFGGPVIFPFGSFLSAIIILLLTERSKGWKDFFYRCVQWRVRFIWYLAALVAPLVISFGALYLNVVFGGGTPPVFAAQWYEVLLMLPLALFDAPLWEDSGWRGFAMPRFPARRSRLLNTLILGMLLAGWHLPIALSGGAVAFPYVITTIISAFVTNWIYFHSGKSALMAMLYHSTANAIGIMFFHGQSDDGLLHLFWFLTATNFVAAVVIIIADRKFWLQSEGDFKEAQTD